MSFNTIRENIVLAKFSGFAVSSLKTRIEFQLPCSLYLNEEKISVKEYTHYYFPRHDKTSSSCLKETRRGAY